MDQVLRGMAFLLVGLLLVLCNLYYVRALIALRSPRYTIVPISVVGAVDESGDPTDGLALAQLLQARIQSIEREIGAANEALTATAPLASARVRPVGILPGELAAFVSPLEVLTLPTAVLSTPDIKIAVSGIEVGGLVSWFRSRISQKQTLSYAIYLTPGEGKKLAAADLSAISGRTHGTEWIESTSTVGDIISDLAYLTIKMQASPVGSSPVEALSLQEFRTLVDSIAAVSNLNQRIRVGLIPDKEDYAEIAGELDPLVSRAPRWPELRHMLAVVSERAQNYDRAASLYRSVQSSRREASPELLEAIESGEIADSIARVDAQRSRRGMLRDHQVDEEKAKAAMLAALDDVWPAYEALFRFSQPRPELKIEQGLVNAFWSPQENVILVGGMWESTPDIIYHEAAHPFITEFIELDTLMSDSLDDPGQRAVEEALAVEYSYAAALASWFKQKKADQSAEEADWVLFPGAAAWILDDRAVESRPLRSLGEPGTAFHGDSQTSDYQLVRDGTVRDAHAASGVGSKAFYEMAISVGTESAIRLWVEALPMLEDPPTLPGLARATLAGAEATKDPHLIEAVRRAWVIVGVQF